MDANTPATPPTQPTPTPTPTPPAPDRSAVQDNGGTPTHPTGPNASPIALGLVAVVLGTLIIANETMTWSVDWSGLGPGAIVVVGVVLLVVGAIGLVRRHDDV